MLITEKDLAILLLTAIMPIETSSQLISNIKCTEYQNYPVQYASQNTSIVQIVMRLSVRFIIGCSGILISDQYVLSSTRCETASIRSFNYIVFNGDEYFQIANVFLYDFDVVSDEEIIPALFKMKQKINIAYHRPACIWTYNDLPQNQIVVHEQTFHTIGQGQTDILRNRYFQVGYLYPVNQCQHHIQVTENMMCLVLKNANQNFIPVTSGPITYVTSNTMYVTGIYADKRDLNRDRLVKALRLTSSNIEWIESIAWAEYKTSNLACGQIRIKHKPLITFGGATYPGQFPWHVAINRREGFGYKRYICGGTIINNQTILTAAHCVHSELGTTSPNILTVEVGKFDLNLKSEQSFELQVAAVWPHEHFHRDTLEHDIAILKLNNFIRFSDFIQPICITNNTNIFDNNVGIVPGWGRNELNTPQVELSQAALPIRDNHECRNSNRNFFTNYLNEFNFCAGYQNGTNVCTGDSGGGFVLQKETRWYIKGIVSLGVSLPNLDRCDPTELVLFTDVVKYYQWIYARA